jgi:hypothetical protein
VLSPVSFYREMTGKEKDPGDAYVELGIGTDHPPPSSAEVKERVVLLLYSPSGPLWPVLG